MYDSDSTIYCDQDHIEVTDRRATVYTSQQADSRRHMHVHAHKTIFRQSEIDTSALVYIQNLYTA